jgi:hypothetical protein
VHTGKLIGLRPWARTEKRDPIDKSVLINELADPRRPLFPKEDFKIVKPVAMTSSQRGEVEKETETVFRNL